jgi:hypothetical protein
MCARKGEASWRETRQSLRDPCSMGDGALRIEAKAQELRGDGLEVAKGGRGGEHLGPGAAKDLGALEDVRARRRGKSI